MAADYDSDQQMVAGPLLLGGNQVLRFLGRFREHRELVLPDEKQGTGRFPYVEEGGALWCSSLLWYESCKHAFESG
jgi:hypothetical protein